MGGYVFVYVEGEGRREKNRERNVEGSKVLWFNYLSPSPTFIYFIQHLFSKSQFPM